MGRRGRKPKPTTLKVLEGTRRDRLNQAELSPATTLPEVPEHLDAYGVEAWQRLAPRLDRLGLLTEVDGEALSLYCATYSRWRLARLDVEENGFSISTGLGGSKSNPAAAVVAEASRLMASLLAEFGLTPASRSRVQSSSPPPRDALAEFLNRRKT